MQQRRMHSWMAWGRLMLFLMLVAQIASAQEPRNGPGVTASEIKLGQTMPYSGPASAFATIGRAEQAYFAMINTQGGVNGRRIKLISLDDGFNPAKTVEQTRKLVEEDQVLALFNSLGPGQQAVKKYVSQNKVPHLFIGSGAREWDDPKQFPWSMGFAPAFEAEGRAFGSYILQHYPHAKVGVLAVNLDLGRDGLQGLQEVLAQNGGAIVVQVAWHEYTDPTVDSQLVALKAAGADVLVDWSNPKTAAQVIRKLHDIGWRPLHLLSFVSSSIEAVLRPAGLEKSIGIVTTGFLKHPSDPTWRGDPAMNEYLAWMKKFYPDGDTADAYNVYAYLAAETMTYVLKQCGDDLTRENVMRKAASIHDLELPLLLPGLKVNTSASNYRPVSYLQLLRFDGTRWARIAGVWDQR